MTIEKGHVMKTGRHIIQTLLLLGLWLGWMLTVQAQTRTVHLYYTDPQGTVLAKTDAQGNILARYDYTPYGNAVASLGSAPNGPGYTGHVNDPETGLVYMQQRYYQPIGRFPSPDPVGPVPGNIYSFNRYAYADNNPINHVDPDGRCIEDACIVEIIVGGAILGGGFDAAVQKWMHPNKPINKTEVVISAAGGALTGGSSALLTGTAVKGTITVAQAVLRQAAVSGAVGAAESATNDVAKGQAISGQSALNAAGANIIGSFVSSGLSTFGGAFSGASENGMLNSMSKSATGSPAGIGVTIANTTKSTGSPLIVPSLSQSIFSQSSHLGDASSDILEQKLDQNQ